MQIIKIVDLNKTYKKRNKEVFALKKINLTINEGEFVSIVGESGGGKSTLLNILSGIEKATSGEVYIEENNILDMNNEKFIIYRRRNMGIVLQFFNLLPLLTVKENIELPVSLDNGKVDKELFNYLIDYFKLNERLDHFPDELSVGEKQKVLICRALITKPYILLLDEPTKNLDKKNSQDTIDLIKIFKNKYGITTIMVTSDLTHASFSDKIVKLENGIILDKNDEYNK